MPLSISVLVLISAVSCCILLSALLERRESHDDVSPALLRVRIHIFEGRLRQLEEEQSLLTQQIEERQESGESCLQLRELRQEKDSLILEQRLQIQQMRQELLRIQLLEENNQEEQKKAKESKRKLDVSNQLFFQTLNDGSDASAAFVEKASGQLVDNSDEECQTHSNREWKNRFLTVPKQECSICLDAYKAGNTVAWAKSDACVHIFHDNCIIEWLEQNHNHCPLCRLDIMSSENL
jgi:hypothetical protein